MAYTFEDFIDEFSKARSVAVLTGAGISAESGVPTFRGKGGIWEEVSIEEVATISAFLRNPVRVWEWFTDLRKIFEKCGPNAAHSSLAALEDHFDDLTIITQNIDNYHQKSGSRNVVELHGNAWWDRCWSCGKRYEVKILEHEKLPPRCDCGGTLKPDVVFFEEQLPLQAVNKAFRTVESCQFMLVVGTSAIVTPAAALPYIGHRAGARIIEINLEPTGHTSFASLSLFEPATVALHRILEALNNL